MRFIAGSFQDKFSTMPADQRHRDRVLHARQPAANGTLAAGRPGRPARQPDNGSSISLTQINGQRYIDVTFVSRSGAAINETTINGDEFTLSGAITADLIMLPGTGGIPDIVGTPLRIGANTYRYFLRVNKPLAPRRRAPVGTPGAGSGTVHRPAR